MSVRDEAKDPWSYVVAAMTGIAGGVALALGPATVAAGAAVGALVGATVLATKVLGGAFVREQIAERRLRVIDRTPEAAWVERAEAAQRSFAELCASAPPGPIAERITTFGAETDASLASLQRLAGQASAVRTALARIDAQRLAAEHDRLTTALHQDADPAVRTEHERAFASVQGQLDAYQRLAGALTMLLARLESGTIGLEGLVARLAEVVALAETSGAATERLSEVDSLAEELEGLRAGLVEAEGVTNRAIEGLAPLPGAVPGSVPGSSAPQARRSTE
jgi:hypothetical protein